MPTHLEPIDKEGSAFRVLLDGKRIGHVISNATMGDKIWQFAVGDGPPRGVFTEAQHAADQLAVNHLQRRKKK